MARPRMSLYGNILHCTNILAVPPRIESNCLTACAIVCYGILRGRSVGNAHCSHLNVPVPREGARGTARPWPRLSRHLSRGPAVQRVGQRRTPRRGDPGRAGGPCAGLRSAPHRSEEHTSELQSLTNLVCRLLL